MSSDSCWDYCYHTYNKYINRNWFSTICCIDHINHSVEGGHHQPEYPTHTSMVDVVEDIEMDPVRIAEDLEVVVNTDFLWSLRVWLFRM